MHTLRTLAVAAAALMAAAAAHADPKPLPSPAGAEPIDGPSVYEAFKGKEGIARIMEDFVPRIFADPRIARRFTMTNPDRLKLMLTQQVCYLVGGPCEYSGRDMTEVHAKLGLTNADFNALAEDLQISMDREKVPFHAQNRLLARLAPMQRVIVTK
jgi:hemoglobin